MSTIASQFGMPEALKALGIKEINDGTSTGSNSFSSGEIIESYSPVDGQLIGKVKTTTAADYEKVMQSATAAFKTFRAMPAPQKAAHSPNPEVESCVPTHLLDGPQAQRARECKVLLPRTRAKRRCSPGWSRDYR